MHIQDAFHPDGISYGSAEDFSDTDSDPRSSQEKDDKDSPQTEDKFRKYLHKRFRCIGIVFSLKNSSSSKYEKTCSDCIASN